MIVIGTRGSQLAVTQAGGVRDALVASGHPARLQIVRTQGDRLPELGFDKLEGKGFFTAELEAALLGGAVDLAVHSLKDLPTRSPSGLCVAAVAGRHSPADVLVVCAGRLDAAARVLPLPAGARVGTSSIRRSRQLLFLRPDLQVVPVRGNVGTRLDKLRGPDLDAVVLAEAGLQRLGWVPAAWARAHPLPCELFVPAPGQGALAVQARQSDPAVAAALAGLHDPVAAAATAAERQVLQRTGGGCHAPLGAYARPLGPGHWQLEVFWQADPGGPVQRLTVTAPSAEALADRACARLTLAAG